MSDLIERVYKPVGFLLLSVFFFVKYLFRYRRTRAITAAKEGFRDHRVRDASQNAEYLRIFERLSEAYVKAKLQQINVAQPYQVGHLWQRVVDERFAQLSACLRTRDTARLQSLLENFQREEFARGFAEASGDYYAARRVPLYNYQFVDTWYRYFEIYKETADDDSRLSYPAVGNPVGLRYEGQIIPIEAIRFSYYRREILSLLRDVDDPVICEIGGGMGGQAYSILSGSRRAVTYALLDIPEVLVVASYFLLATLPEKRALLYGEKPLDSGTMADYDMVLMPNFVLPELGDDTVDLFFNANSFSEMNADTVEEYLNQIERICRRYLMHINHSARLTWHEGGKSIVNMPANQISPDPRLFKKIYQHPRVFARPEDKLFYLRHGAKHSAFLYERIRPARGNTE